MKKIFIQILAVLLIGLMGCNPMAEIYQELEASKKPFAKTIEYTLTDDDYNTIASVSLVVAENAQDSAACKAIGTYKSFAETRPASKYIPPFLSYKFPALDSGSIAKLTYNYDNSYIFSGEEIITVPQSVYDALGITAFDQNNDPATNIQAYLDTAYTNPTIDRAVVLYDYNDGTNTYTTMLYAYYDNGWVVPTNQYTISDADYESIGGSAAQYHNFSSSYDPNFYIPRILLQHYPYAQAGDQLNVLYKYYSGGLQYHYNLFTFDGQQWNALEEKHEQYIHNGTEWVFDPTVKYEMGCDDYQIIVDWTKNNMPNYMHPLYSNTEYYFGASSYYCNFDMRLTTRRANDPDNLLPADDQEATQELWQRLDQAINILLETKYPDAQPLINGVPVYYEITFSTYEPERHKYMIKFLCTDVGKFTPVDQENAIEYNSHIVLVQ